MDIVNKQFLNSYLTKLLLYCFNKPSTEILKEINDNKDKIICDKCKGLIVIKDGEIYPPLCEKYTFKKWLKDLSFGDKFLYLFLLSMTVLVYLVWCGRL